MFTTDVKPGIILARGVCRELIARGLRPLTEFPTRAGQRMDICAIDPKGEIWCVEVKSSRADFQSDRKWQGYLDWCDRFFFAVPEGFPDEILPFDQGLIRADAYGAEVIRPGPEDRLAAARRKAVTLRFARLAAERLTRLSDEL
ncbi:MmcB family DNA repair protein [Rhodobacteraceae bacterium NNCM2]|nr:MmcB family DNA repair protein [Coraliihabitans acroporae]